MGTLVQVWHCLLKAVDASLLMVSSVLYRYIKDGWFTRVIVLNRQLSLLLAKKGKTLIF